MDSIVWLMLAAALLPYAAAIAAKAGGSAFDNNEPRSWLARQEGWRARANAAQKNLFESLPFFYAAVLLALYAQVSEGWLLMLMSAWVGVRMIYIGVYVGGYGAIRSAVWALAFIINIAILFLAM
ncbi:MAG: MAPEG family protein [Candidimonas sp.]|nr:MAPEG family protein [Candidimonas sp.]